ncbi:MAG: response regulator transcription factor [bacterium]|nr:response regulator transcription factor [bacterium]
MRILVAEDEVTSRLILEKVLTKWGYDVTTAVDGTDAWEKMQEEDAPALALLDWVMPGMDGVEICRRIRKKERPDLPYYIILLTGKDSKADIVKGLRAGANDYVTKPFDNDELRARIDVGRRVVELQSDLSRHVKELQAALDHIQTLQGILPICSYCKKIRDDQNYWQQVESYLSKTTDARFTHSICPGCYKEHVKPQLAQLKQKKIS